MKHPGGLSMLMMALLVRMAAADEVEGQKGTAAAPQGQAPTAEETATTPTRADWLEAVWTQVDELTVEKEFAPQETVTTSGVRGAEARDTILDKLYYRGSRPGSPERAGEGSGTGKEAAQGVAAGASRAAGRVDGLMHIETQGDFLPPMNAGRPGESTAW